MAAIARINSRTIIPPDCVDEDAIQVYTVTVRFTRSEVAAALTAIQEANAPTYSGSDVAVLAHRAAIAAGGERVTEAQMRALQLDSFALALARRAGGS